MKDILALEGRAALVTGAAQGIGFHTAKMMAEHGMKVAVVDINGEKAAKAAAEINASGGAQAIAVSCDVSDEKAIEAMVETVAGQLGGIDVVANCAGILSSTKIPEMTRAEWDRMLAVNLSGPFFVIQKALPYLKKSKAGRIINISSTAGRMGGVENSMSYTAAKGGICAISRGIARQVAPFGITCNAVCPGPTATDIVQAYTEAQLEHLNRQIMLGRLAKPEEIAAAVCYLASEKGGYVTGAMLDVNGGFWVG